MTIETRTVYVSTTGQVFMDKESCIRCDLDEITLRIDAISAAERSNHLCAVDILCSVKLRPYISEIIELLKQLPEV